jgi:hypothetical protein
VSGSVLGTTVSMAENVVAVEDEDVGAGFQSENVDWDDDGGEVEV